MFRERAAGNVALARKGGGGFRSLLVIQGNRLQSFS